MSIGPESRKQVAKMTEWIATDALKRIFMYKRTGIKVGDSMKFPTAKITQTKFNKKRSVVGDELKFEQTT